MADAYKGLTIRIGADTRPLSSAMRSISQSTSQVQSHVNKLSKALKFDTTDVKAMGARIGLMRDKIILTARSSATLLTSIGQVDSEAKKLGYSMNNVYSKAQQTKSEFNHLNATLERCYDAVIDIAKIDPSIGPKKAKKYVNDLRESMRKGGAEADEAEAKIRGMLELAGNNKIIAKSNGLNKIANDGKELLTVYDRLRAVHDSYQKKLSVLNKIEGSRSARIALVEYEAELRQAISETARFKNELYSVGTSSGLRQTKSELIKIDSAIERAHSSAVAMDEAMKVLPKSLSAAIAKTDAFAAAEDLLNRKLDILKNRMRELQRIGGFNPAKLEAKEAAAAVEQATAAYEKWYFKLARVTAAADRLDTELAELRKQGKGAGDEQFDRLKAKVDKAHAAVEKLEHAFVEADAALERANIPAEFIKATNEAIKTEAEIGKLQTKMSKMTAAADFGRQLRSGGYGLYSTITPALMIMGRYAVQAADDIDTAYRNMRKTVNGTEEEFEHLKNAALEFSTTHVTTADTILEIEALGGQLGIASSNLEAFSETVSSLDIATDIDAESLATYLGQLSNIMNDMKGTKGNAEKYRDTLNSFADALVRLGNNSAAQESNIMRVMMRIASMGTISGFTTPELLAIADAVAATGQGAEAAGTAISKTFSNIESAVAAGKEDLEAFASVAGMTSDEFTEAWNNKPIEAFTAFIGGLKRIDEGGGSVDKTLRELGITSVRQKQALMGLTQTFDVLSSSIGMANDAWNKQSTTMADGSIEKTGDAAREAQKKSEGFSGALGMMQNQAKLLGVELADGIAPTIHMLSGTFSGLAQAFHNMPAATKSAIVSFGAFAAALGPVFVATGAVLTSIKPIKEVFDAASGAAVKAKARLGQYALAAGSNKNLIDKFAQTMSKTSWLGIAAGAAAAYFVISSIAKILQDNAKYQEDVAKSTTKMKDIVAGSIPVWDRFAGTLGKVGTKTSAVRLSYADFFDTLAKTVDGIKERNEQAQSEIDLLNKATSSIDKYMNKTGLSVEEQGELYTAVKIVNDALGTQYKVVDAANGKIADEKGVLQETSSAIKGYVAVKRDQIRMDALAADAQDLLNQKSEATRNVLEAERDLRTMEESAAAAQSEDQRKAWEAAIAAKQTQIDDLRNARDALSDSLSTVYDAMGNLQADMGKGISERTLGSYASYMSELKDIFDIDFENTGVNIGEMLKKFTSDLDTTGVSIAEFEALGVDKMHELVTAWASNGNDIIAAFDSIGVSADTLTNKFMRAFEDQGKSFFDFASEFGWHVDDLSAKLNSVGYSAEFMASLSQEQLDALLAAAGGDIDTLIKALDELSGRTATVNIETNTEDAAAEAATLQQMADQYGDTDAEADYSINGEEAEDEDEELNTRGQSYDAQTFTATADLNTDPAHQKLDALIQRLNDWASTPLVKSVSADTSGGNASGGISDAVIRAIPRHAAGGINGIVTRPTLTNVGLTGEAGAEAILHMRHAGGAIVPLSNRHYVRPFAKAVASEIPGGYATSNVTNIYIDGAQINARPEMEAEFYRCMQDLKRIAG